MLPPRWLPRLSRARILLFDTADAITSRSNLFFCGNAACSVSGTPFHETWLARSAYDARCEIATSQVTDLGNLSSNQLSAENQSNMFDIAAARAFAPLT
jgi:hypothetical protein